VDFSYKRLVFDEIAREARTVLVLDHHKTAAEELRGLPVPPATYSALRDPATVSNPFRVCALFDMERSGAGLKAGFPNRTNGPEPAKSAFRLWLTYQMGGGDAIDPLRALPPHRRATNLRSGPFDHLVGASHQYRRELFQLFKS